MDNFDPAQAAQPALPKTPLALTPCFESIWADWAQGAGRLPSLIIRRRPAEGVRPTRRPPVLAT